MNILIVGSGAREHAMAKAFARSATPSKLFCFGTSHNPGISSLTTQYATGDLCACETIVQKALEWNIQLAVIGPEAPLEAGLVDCLEQQNILCAGPRKALARIETSKSFARKLLTKARIKASPRYQHFTSMQGVEAFLNSLGEDRYVIKADGLMGGKGVKVAGDHLHSIAEALQYAQELQAQNIPFLIEEKLIGQEFSLICFTDGKCIVPMPVVQDHKRAYEQDKGPNTGGMGSYSDANHRLPFLTAQDIKSAQNVNEAVLHALEKECGEPFKGFLYGSFIATANGIYLIEYNARLGDPEALNLLSILDADFVAICQAIAHGQLSKIPIHFKPYATVCKYAVPKGYPDEPLKNIPLDISQVNSRERLCLGAVNEQDGILLATGSRAIAVVGIAPNIEDAEAIAEAEIGRIKGEVFHRSDIGTAALIHQRIQMMQQLRVEEVLL